MADLGRALGPIDFRDLMSMFLYRKKNIVDEFGVGVDRIIKVVDVFFFTLF